MSRHSEQTIQTTARMKRPESHGLMHDTKKRRILGDVLSYLFLGVMAIIWLIPIVWVFAESFNKNTAPYTKTFFPTEFSLDNYITLFTDRSVLNFPKMFMNTFIVACFVCLISVVFVLSVAYCMSRMRFRTRKTFMNVVLVLGMFPGIMAVFRHLLHLEGRGPHQRRHDHHRPDSGLLRRYRRGLLRDEGIHGYDSDLA